MVLLIRSPFGKQFLFAYAGKARTCVDLKVHKIWMVPVFAEIKLSSASSLASDSSFWMNKLIMPSKLLTQQKPWLKIARVLSDVRCQQEN